MLYFAKLMSKTMQNDNAVTLDCHATETRGRSSRAKAGLEKLQAHNGIHKGPACKCSHFSQGKEIDDESQ